MILKISGDIFADPAQKLIQERDTDFQARLAPIGRNATYLHRSILHTHLRSCRRIHAGTWPSTSAWTRESCVTAKCRRVGRDPSTQPMMTKSRPSCLVQR